MNEVLGAIVTITKIGQDGHRPSKEDLAMQLLLIVSLGLAILTVIFALQNPIPVGVTFLIWRLLGLGADINIRGGSNSEFIDIDSCYRKKKIDDFKSDEENN